jgi:hypothetical protein
MKRIAKYYFEWMVRKDLAWFDIYMDREEFSNVVNEYEIILLENYTLMLVYII